jgi:hypothetical protein
MLPAKIQSSRSLILRGPRRDWPRHRKFVRSRCCVVTLGKVHDDCDGPIQACHYRTAANSGKSLKPADWWTFSACHKHHAEQHQIGQDAFERKYGLDLTSICVEFAQLSPDVQMKGARRNDMPELPDTLDNTEESNQEIV